MVFPKRQQKLRIKRCHYLVDHDWGTGRLGLEEVLLIPEEAHELAAQHSVVGLPGPGNTGQLKMLFALLRIRIRIRRIGMFLGLLFVNACGTESNITIYKVPYPWTNELHIKTPPYPMSREPRKRRPTHCRFPCRVDSAGPVSPTCT